MFSLLEPAGAVALSERALMFHATLLMLIVVVPVFILAFAIAWRYRASNKKAKYTPDWEHSKLEELIWWVIPLEIILVLGALTWSSTHELDPYKPLVSEQTPVVVQVVALNWKWLFIYPELGVASVNELALPVGRPVTFLITADAPMNSFWIPKLGGQMYAMTGMVTNTHLIANDVGVYEGTSANYSGDGFASMKFKTKALSSTDFDAWVAQAKASSFLLNKVAYDELSKDSLASTTLYSFVDAKLFESVVNTYMPMTNSPAHVH